MLLVLGVATGYLFTLCAQPSPPLWAQLAFIPIGLGFVVKLFGLFTGLF